MIALIWQCYEMLLDEDSAVAGRQRMFALSKTLRRARSSAINDQLMARDVPVIGSSFVPRV